MAYQGGADYDRFAGALVLVLAAAMTLVAGYSIFFVPREPAPANAKAYGCYTSAEAAPILLDATGMTILQEPVLRMGFHLERDKRGIALTAEAPIAAEPRAATYRYAVRPPGVGVYLPFFREEGGRSYGVFDEGLLDGFTMGASDGAVLPYRKTDAAACGQ